MSYRRVEKESDELLYTVWSLVMVRETNCQRKRLTVLMPHTQRLWLFKNTVEKYACIKSRANVTSPSTNPYPSYRPIQMALQSTRDVFQIFFKSVDRQRSSRKITLANCEEVFYNRACALYNTLTSRRPRCIISSSDRQRNISN